MSAPIELRQPNNTRITRTQSGRDCAYISVDGKCVISVTDLDYYENALVSVEAKVAVCAKGNDSKKEIADGT